MSDSEAHNHNYAAQVFTRVSLSPKRSRNNTPQTSPSRREKPSLLNSPAHTPTSRLDSSMTSQVTYLSEADLIQDDDEDEEHISPDPATNVQKRLVLSPKRSTGSPEKSVGTPDTPDTPVNNPVTPSPDAASPVNTPSISSNPKPASASKIDSYATEVQYAISHEQQG